jgi:peroxiredoxin
VLTFPVLSDPGNQVARAWGVLTEPTPEVLAAQRTLGLKLTEVNADGTHSLPLPTVAIIDAAGVIRWIDVHPNYATRTEVNAIITAVDSVLGGQPTTAR